VRGPERGAQVRNSFRDFVDPISSQAEEHPTRNGAIVLGLGILIIVLVVLNKVPFLDSTGGYTLRADFAKINNVNTRTPVRVDGVDVGEVSGVGAGPDAYRSSEVKMNITQSGLVVHSNATASIRWRTVLGGPMYIDLNPGSPDAPRLSGAIPVSHTSDQTELDDVLRIYNGSTDQAQRDTFKGLAATFGAPHQTGASINALPDLTTVGAGLKGYQGTDPGDLSKLVATTARTVTQLGASTTSLQNLVDGADQTLGALDAQSPSLGRMLALSPGTLSSTYVTSKRLVITLNKLDPLVRNLEPGSKLIYSMSNALQPALNQARSVLTNAQPLLRNAQPTFSSLRGAAAAGTPFFQGLRAPVARLNSNILPWLAQRDTDTRLLNYESIGPFFSVLDKAASEYDASGYRLHLTTLLGSASVTDEAALTTAGHSALMSQCRQAAKPAQLKDCGAVTNVLMGLLFGAKK
jgi:phospholipid/cholesterol/gamma-HCH transport system substrate-binding protein